MSKNLALSAVVLLASALPSWAADAFDRYTNPLLAKLTTAEGTREVSQLTPKLIAENRQVLPGLASTFIVVKTNDGRYAKLLVRSLRQRVNGKPPVPILAIDRYVTYRSGQEQTVETSGQNLSLFGGFHFSLDIGQVVPADLSGDLRFVTAEGKVALEPVEKAKLYLVTKPLPEAAPKKTAQPTFGPTFEPRWVAGTYKLYDDGRRTGKLTLQVNDEGEVTGSYYSDKDGQKYDVEGKLGNPRYAVQFTIKYPQAAEVFHGWLFSGDGKALAGTSRLREREAGFYAVRTEEE
jgi:hypothetical protein